MTVFRAFYVKLKRNKIHLFYILLILFVIININLILKIKINYIQKLNSNIFNSHDLIESNKRIQSKSTGNNSSSKFSDNPIIFVGGSPRSGTTLMR